MHQGPSYPCCRPANERCFFNGPGQAGKRKMSFPTAQARLTKQKRIIMYDLGDNKYKCANGICPSIFITGLETKIY